MPRVAKRKVVATKTKGGSAAKAGRFRKVINVKAKEIREYIHAKVFEKYTPILQSEYEAYQDELNNTPKVWDFMHTKFEKIDQPLDYTIKNLKSLLTAIAKVTISDKPQPLKFTDYERVTLAKTINQDAKKNTNITRQLYIDEKKTRYVEHHLPHLKRLGQIALLGVAKPLRLKATAKAKAKTLYNKELETYQDKKKELIQAMMDSSGRSRVETKEEYKEQAKAALGQHIRTIRRLLKGTYSSKVDGKAAPIEEIHDVIAKIWGFAESYRNPSMIAYLILTLHNLKHQAVSLRKAVEGNRAYAPSQGEASNKLMEFARPDKNPTDPVMIEQMENNIILFFQEIFRKEQNSGFNTNHEYTGDLVNRKLTYIDKGSKKDANDFNALWQDIIDRKIINHLD